MSPCLVVPCASNAFRTFTLARTARSTRINRTRWVATLERLESGEAMPKGAPRLHNLDLALDDLHTQSTIIGMRQGAHDSKVTRGIVAALGGQTDALCLQSDEFDDLPELQAVGDGLVHALADASTATSCASHT